MDDRLFPSQPGILSAAGGDHVGVGALLARHIPGVRLFVHLTAGADLLARETPSDIVQSACLEVLQDVGKHEWKSEGHFRNWLYQEAKRKILDRKKYWGAERRAGHRDALQADPASSAPGPVSALRDPGAATPSENVIAFENMEAFESAFANLPEDQRRVFLMSRVLAMSYAEIAAELEIGEANVRQLHSRALAKLVRHLSPLD